MHDQRVYFGAPLGSLVRCAHHAVLAAPSNACQFQSCEAHALPSSEILGLQACKEAHTVTEAERDLTIGSTDVKNEDDVSKASVEVSDELPGQDAPQYFAMLQSAAYCSASAFS